MYLTERRVSMNYTGLYFGVLYILWWSAHGTSCAASLQKARFC